MADPDLQIRGGGGHPDPEIRPGSVTVYIAKDNKLKILAVEVLTYVQDPSDLKKKIDHLYQQSAILLLQTQTLGLRSIGKSGFRF